MKEMYATTIVTRYELGTAGSVFIEYEVDMEYNYEGECDKLLTELDTLLKIAQQPFKGKIERDDFLQTLKQEAENGSRTYADASIDEPPQCVQNCGSGESVEVTRSPSACPIPPPTPTFSPNYNGPPISNQPVLPPQDPGAPLKTRIVERWLSVHIYGLRTESNPEETPSMYEYANIWERETALYTCKYFQGNITVWNLQCQTDLIGVAESSTLYNNGRSLSDQENSIEHRTDIDRSLQFSSMTDSSLNKLNPKTCSHSMKNNGVYDHGCDIICSQGDGGSDKIYNPAEGPAMYLIYRQIFRYSDFPSVGRRIRADDLATTPFLCNANRIKYAKELEKHVSGRITGISALDLHTPGSNYVFNVDDLVMAITINGYLTDDIKEIDDNPYDPYKAQLKLKFQAAMDKRIEDFWTKERKWAAIFDLEVQTEVVYSEYRRTFRTDKAFADYFYVQYEINFRYRSMYRRSFLNPYRVTLDPLKNRTVLYDDEDNGSTEFLKILMNRRQPEDAEVTFSGTVGEIKEFGFLNANEFGIVREDDSIDPKLASTAIVLIVVSVTLLVFAVSILRGWWVKKGRPRLDENSCGEFNDDDENEDMNSFKDLCGSQAFDNVDDATLRLQNCFDASGSYSMSKPDLERSRGTSVYYEDNGSILETKMEYHPVDLNSYEDENG